MSNRYNGLENNLAALQDFIKRDPESYREEFAQQYRHYEHTVRLFQLQPNLNSDQLIDVVTFLCHVAHCYPEQTKTLSSDIANILAVSGQVLDPGLRIALCKCLVLLRSKSMADSIDVLKLFFDLAKCQDKALRKFVFESTVSHVKQLTLKKQNPRLRTSVQAFVFAKLTDAHAVVCRLALLLCIDLYRKRFWQDAKTANAISRACFHKVTKVYVTACKFFLGKDAFDEKNEVSSSDDDEDNSSSSKNQKSIKEIMVGYNAGKKTRKRKKMLEKSKDNLKKADRKQNKKHSKLKQLDFSAFHYLYDAQDFVEKLFKKLEKCTDRYEVKMTLMALIARVVGIHKLQLLNFYPFLQKYVQPRQRDVTKILLFAAQATHELVPPDVVKDLLKAIINNFVSDRNSAEAIAVGLNTCKEIAERCPLALDQDLLDDLVEYKKYKNKNVSMSAKGIIQTFRDINPKMLKKQDRGRPTEASKAVQPMQYFGESRPAQALIPGAECLIDDVKKQVQDVKQQQEDENGNEECDQSDAESGSEASFSDWEEMEEEEEEENDDASDENQTSETQGETEETATREEEEKQQEKRVTFAQNISETKIFSQDDFKRIRAFKLRQHVEPSKSRKRVAEEELSFDLEDAASSDDEDDERPELTRLRDIEHLHKRLKQDKQARLETVKSGREGRQRFGKPKAKGPHVGRTNRQLAKRKAFSMVRQKQTGKAKKRSFRDKQRALSNYLTNQRKMR